MAKWKAQNTETAEIREFDTAAEAKAWATEETDRFGSWWRNEIEPGVFVWEKGRERELSALVWQTKDEEAVVLCYGIFIE